MTEKIKDQEATMFEGLFCSLTSNADDNEWCHWTAYYQLASMDSYLSKHVSAHI